MTSTPWQLPLINVNFDSIEFISEAQWISWLSQEVGIATSRNEKCLVASLFEKSLSQCDAFELWKMYCEFIREDIELYFHLKKEAPKHVEPTIYNLPDQCLDVFHRALDIHGAQFILSPLLWDPYFQLCRTLGIPTEKLREIFHDRLRIPHRTLSDTFSAYSAFEAQIDPSSYEKHYAEGNQIYQATLAEVQWMEEFEKGLGSSDKPNQFLHYISRCTLNPSHIAGMYERALSETDSSVIIWISYLIWTILERKSKEIASKIALRATKMFPNSSELACYVLRLGLEKKINSKDSESSSNVLPSLLYTMSSCEDFSKVFLELLRVNQTMETPADMIGLIKTGFTVRSQLFPLPTDEPANIELVSWCLEYLYREQEEDSRIYEELLELFSSSAVLFKDWLPLLSAQLLRSTPQPLFNLAVEKVKDHQDLVLELWLEYVYRYHGYEQVEYVRNLIQQHTAYVHYCQSLSLTTQAPSNTTESSSTRKRERLETSTAMDVDQDRTDQTFVVKHVSGRQMEYLKQQYAQYGLIKKVRFLKSKTPGEQGQLFIQMDSKLAVLNIFKHCQRDLKNEPRVFEMVKGATWDPHFVIRKELQEIQQRKLQQQQEYLANQDTTLFVANLAPSVTQEDLSNLFHNVEDVRLMQTKTGSSKGYAYVQFQSVQAKEKGLQLHGTVFKERVLYVANSNPESRKNINLDHVKGSRVRDLDPCLIYVTNLPFNTGQKEISELSKAMEVRLVLDAKQRSRGIAFCHYSTEEEAQQALEKLNGLVVEGRILEASIAQPTRRGVKREDYEAKVKKQAKLSEDKEGGVTPKQKASFPSLPRTVLHRAPKKKVKLLPSNQPNQESNMQEQMQVDEPKEKLKDNAYFRDLLLSSKKK